MSYEFLVLIVFINVLATLALWRAQNPEKLKKKFLHALRHAEPLVPKHNPPRSMDGVMVGDRHRAFFKDFAEFGAVANWWLSDDVGGPWRLQELPSTKLMLTHFDGPQFGRRYEIFHNQVRIGVLEASPGFPYSSEKRQVYVNLKLEWVRLLSFQRVRGFLSGIALHISDESDARATIDVALTEVLWDAVKVPEYNFGPDYGDLELQLHGAANWYFERRVAFLKSAAS